MAHEHDEIPELPPAILVDNPSDLHLLDQALRRAERVAIDTESNSLYAYQEQVCLIQMSIGKQDYLLDPLQVDVSNDLPAFAEVMADPTIEKVLHAAEYDIICLRRDFDIQINNLFDTMIAARILGWEQIGLARLLDQFFGVKPDKRHQLADWGQRPLPWSMLVYAQMDTHYLLRMRDELYANLAARGHLEEMTELCAEVTQAEWSRTDFSPDDFWRISGAQYLEPHEAAVLRSLFVMRDREARRLDRPVFKVIHDNALLEVAKQQPDTVEALATIKGISRGQARRLGRRIFGAIRHGQQASPPKRTSNHNGRRPDDDVMRRYEALHSWRKETAIARGVSSEIVMSKDTMWDLAHKAPRAYADLEDISGLGPWRLQAYGDDVLAVLASSDETVQ